MQDSGQPEDAGTAKPEDAGTEATWGTISRRQRKENSGQPENFDPRQSRKVEGAGKLATNTGKRRWKSGAEGKPEAPAPEALKDARFGATRMSVAGTAGRCRNRATRGLINRCNQRSKATGQLGA